MVSVFDYEKLLSLLKDFYVITRIRITVFDDEMNEMISYPEQVAGFCKIVRSTQAGRTACANCDRAACERAGRERKTQLYRCHAGMTEAVTPLFVNDILAGYLLFGHVFSYDSFEEGWPEIQRCCEHLPLDMDALKEACKERPIISQDYVRSATQILLAVSQYLVMEQMAAPHKDTLASSFDQYISSHFTQDLNVPQLCSHFHIGKTQLYKLSRRLYGCGVAAHIRSLRIRLAKQLLSAEEDLSLGEIAFRCGYSDYNYFINVFTRETGSPPGAFRKSSHRAKMQGVHK